MDDGMNAVVLPGNIQVVQIIPNDEDEGSQQTILTAATNEIDWASIPVTIGPAQPELCDEEAAVDEPVDDPEAESNAVLTDKIDETSEYVYIEIEKNEEESNVDQSSPCFLFPDGTLRSLDELVIVEDVDVEEDAPEVPKKTRKYVCLFEGCSRVYSSQHHLKVHARIHTGERPYKCPYAECNKEFNRDYSLKSHLRTHTGERPYACPFFCGKAFKTSGDLQKHTRTHTGERPFQCPVEGCDKSFTTSNTCRIHLRRHTGEKPYICQEEGCGKAFSSSTNFKNHSRIHSGEQPYACSVEGCEKTFTEYSSLYKHRTVHSQEKRYKCGYCDKAYRQMTSLTTHKRAVHGVVTSDDGSEMVLEQATEASNEELDALQTVAPDLSSDSPIHFKSMNLDDDDYGAIYEIV